MRLWHQAFKEDFCLPIAMDSASVSFKQGSLLISGDDGANRKDELAVKERELWVKTTQNRGCAREEEGKAQQRKEKVEGSLIAPVAAQ